MKSRLPVLVLIAAATLACSAQGATPPIPARADAPPRFLPPGWRLETQLEADFDRDGKTDIAMIVRNDEERFLLVAVGEGKGLHRVGLGALDPYPLGDAKLTAPKGVLVIEDLTGGTTAIASLYRYRYDMATGRMQLIGDDVEVYSRTNAHGGTKMSTNRLTGAQTRQVSHLDAKGEYRFSKVKTSRVAKVKMYLENAPAPEATLGTGD